MDILKESLTKEEQPEHKKKEKMGQEESDEEVEPEPRTLGNTFSRSANENIEEDSTERNLNFSSMIEDDPNEIDKKLPLRVRTDCESIIMWLFKLKVFIRFLCDLISKNTKASMIDFKSLPCYVFRLGD